MFKSTPNISSLLSKRKSLQNELDLLDEATKLFENKTNDSFKDTRSIQQVFSQFCKERQEEDKKLHRGANFNDLQEIYASTELFDLSLIPENPEYQVERRGIVAKNEKLISSALPFQAVFLRVSGNSGNGYLFAREFSPTQITGTLYIVLEAKPNYVVSNNPFILDTETGMITLMGDRIELFERLLDTELNSSLVGKIKESSLMSMLCDISFTLEILNTLNKRKVYSETKATEKTEYYRRKGKPTIKVSARPLYYVLEPKDVDSEKKVVSRASSSCKIELNHSFKVRGHWRRINENSYGKNRNGEYVVTGFTWVVDHVRGEGEMVRRLRVIKQN